jgi:hypothetical protein
LYEKSQASNIVTESADTLAEEAREATKKNRGWNANTDRMVYQWEEEKGTRRSVWTLGVRKCVRKGAGQFVEKSTREKATRRWRELHFERGCQARLVKRVCPQAWMQLTAEGLMGLRCDAASAQWRRHGQRVLERKARVRRQGNKARGQWTAFDDNVGSRFLTQKRAEQRGTWKVANEQSCHGAVEEKEKNLASPNRAS